MYIWFITPYFDTQISAKEFQVAALLYDLTFFGSLVIFLFSEVVLWRQIIVSDT